MAVDGRIIGVEDVHRILDKAKSEYSRVLEVAREYERLVAQLEYKFKDKVDLAGYANSSKIHRIIAYLENGHYAK